VGFFHILVLFHSSIFLVRLFHIPEPRSRKIPSKTWRECIKKIWEVDPLACPQCGGEMKIISFIDEPMLICRILEHLKLWQERIPKGLPPPEEEGDNAEAVVCESFDDGWGRYDEMGNTLH
jgi:hypothetical protein